ncbi:MAG: VOC family protein [Ilumatobacteraceae bacterium]
MVQTMTATEFHATTDLPDWRFIRTRIETTFAAASFDAAAHFALDVAAAAEAAAHHPDLDIRYPGLVHIALTTHAAGGTVTDLDVALAATISGLAERWGLRSEPQRAQVCEVAIDAMDIAAVRPFWQALLAYVPEPPHEETGMVVAIVDPSRIGPAFWFQQMDAPRPQRNRIHLDITVPADAAEHRIAAAIAAGGHLVTDEHARAFWVLADPEGNEACICTWEDRDDAAPPGGILRS